MIDSGMTPEICAQVVMENIPGVMRTIRSELRNQGSTALSVPQFRALNFLSHQPGASLTDVADYLGITRATASSLVDRLVQRALVDRAEDPSERRRSVLTLTPTGAWLLNSARQATRAWLANVLGGLGTEELKAVTTGIELLGRVFNLTTEG